MAVRIPLEDISLHHAAHFRAPASGDPGGAFAILIVLLLLLLSAVVLLLLGIALLAWLLRPSGKEVDVVPLQTGKDVFWIPVSKRERRRTRPGDRMADKRGRSGR